MSKPSSKSAGKRGAGRSQAQAATPDRSFYIGFVVIGLFVVFLVAILTEGDYWKEGALAFMALFAVQVNLQAISVYRGNVPSAGWNRALARLPLRCAGYGTKGGHPIEAAHGDAQACKMIVASIVFSVVVIGGLAACLLWPYFQ